MHGGKGMAKILCYIYEGMADFEITLLLHRLRNTGKMEIVTISEDKEEITAQSGMHYISDKKSVILRRFQNMRHSLFRADLLIMNRMR